MFQLDLELLKRSFQRAKPSPQPSPAQDQMLVWKHGIAVHLVRSPRARRYLLRLQPDGTARLVIPRRGSRSEGLRFLERSETWLLGRLRQWQSLSASREPWQEGRRFLFRGEEVSLRVEEMEKGILLHFADEVVQLPQTLPDYRTPILNYLRQLAHKELPPRTWELAREHNVIIHRVTVRSQKTRWGSCSIRGTLSLNWRLIQAPAFVSDYLIIHELMHRREMNHSARYWKHVADACPAYREAEKWLKQTRLESIP